MADVVIAWFVARGAWVENHWALVLVSIWAACTAFASIHDRWAPKTDAEWAAFLLAHRWFGAAVSLSRSVGWNIPGSIRSARVVAGIIPQYLMGALLRGDLPRDAKQMAQVAKGAIDKAVESAHDEGVVEAQQAEDSVIIELDPSPKTTPKIPPIVGGALLALGVAVSGCGSTGPAKEAANATHDVGIAGADILQRECVEPMQQATTQAQIDAIRAKGCREAVAAYDGLRDAHMTIVAVIKATDAAQCVGVSKASHDCNLAGAYVELAKAAAAWAESVKRIEEASSR